MGTGSGSGTGVDVALGEGLGEGVGVGVGVSVGVCCALPNLFMGTFASKGFNTIPMQIRINRIAKTTVRMRFILHLPDCCHSREHLSVCFLCTLDRHTPNSSQSKFPERKFGADDLC